MARMILEDRLLNPDSPFACSGKGAVTSTSTFVPLLLIVAAFGIYLTDFGLRVEHLVIYSLFCISLPVHMLEKTHLIRVRPLFLLAMLFSVNFLWLLLITLVSTEKGNLRAILANADNFIIPTAIIFLMSAFLRRIIQQDAQRILVKVCDLLVLILAINGLMTVIHVITGESFFFEPFMAPADPLTGRTVWDGSLNMGRYIGVFSTPFEAGITYTLGIFAWVHAAKLRRRSSMSWQVLLVLIVVGGILSVSKAFLLGLFMFIVYLFTDYKRVKTIINWRLILIVPSLVFLTGIFVKQWKGLDFLLRLFLVKVANFNELIILFSGRRYGIENPGSESLAAYVWRTAPFSGLGLGDSSVCDSAYLYNFLHGGLVTLMIQLLILCVLGWSGLKSSKYCEEGKLLTVLTVYVAVANLGAPVLTKNKFATVFWVIVSLVFMIIAHKRRSISERNLINDNISISGPEEVKDKETC